MKSLSIAPRRREQKPREIDESCRQSHRLFGMRVLNASNPASVMQYTARPRSSERRSIQPFASMLAMVCLPAGCIFSIGSPSVGFIFWSVDRSTACGMWLGRGPLLIPQFKGTQSKIFLGGRLTLLTYRRRLD
jgi:hypothetical protein